jgi:hypothetical protein
LLQPAGNVLCIREQTTGAVIMRAIRTILVYLMLVALICLACCAVGLLYLWPRGCPEMDRVKRGMTADEVREVLGDPATQNKEYWVCECPTASHPPVEVHFDADGRVKNVSRFEW